MHLRIHRMKPIIVSLLPSNRRLARACVAVMLGAVLELAASAAVPAAVDHSAGLPPAGDQGSQNSSHAWALAYYVKSYQEGRERGSDLTRPEHQFSPAFLYNQVTIENETSDFATLLARLADQGCATLADMPYDPEDYRTWPPYSAFRHALEFRPEGHTYLGSGLVPGIVGAVKEVLAGGELVVLEVPVFRPDPSRSGRFEQLAAGRAAYDMPPDTDGHIRGYQALTLVGYDEARFEGRGGFQNS